MYGFNKEELKLLRKLNTPQKIQDWLEDIPINFEPGGDTIMSPRRVIATRKAHCLEGALVAAAALWVNGEPPLLLDLTAAKNDSDHVVCLFKRHGKWGAISKTNHAVLRYREPVYKNIRELALSYYHEYFLDNGKKTLVSFSTKPLDLRRYFKSHAWTTTPDDLWVISEALDKLPHERIVSPGLKKHLRRAEPIEIKAGKLTEWKKR